MRVAITEEEMTNENKNCQCFIVGTGEYYHGESDKILCQALVLI